ncbi:hypothetical protein A9Q87_13140 [Flavobacteriales bacterium 34_180_T64]|nr:hypothetical protein A9Q87_13140 [Flavobacteriales bacterium 34_180_T64]
MQRYLLFMLSFVVTSISFSQNNTIAAGEKLTFSASYNMSGLLTEIAEVTMETSEVKTSKTTLLKLKCKATTYSKWDGFFKIRDLYESYVNPNTLTPYLYKRDINEGSYYKFMQYKFNHRTKTVESIKRKKKKIGGTYDVNSTVQIGADTKDIVTTIYHIRNLDIHETNIGDSQSFKVLFDNQEETIYVKYLGKETISTRLGKKECYKLAISMNNSILKGNNANVLWLTADQNKVPVYATFKIAVGNGALSIKSASGLKH